MQKVTELQKKLTDIGKKQFDNTKNKDILRLVKFYHFVSQYDALFFDASDSIVSPLPWLRNEKGEKKRILL